MPKATLLRIPAPKRERLLREAARLFAQRGFDHTDMAQLARRAGVAKGSLYNYFDSKRELYLFVCRRGLQLSREAVYGGLDPQWDIYRQLEHVFTQGVRFAEEHPEYVAIYLHVSAPGMDRFADELSAEVERPTAAWLKQRIRDAQRDGTVRADLDPKLAAFLINGLYIVLLSSLVSRHFQIRLREYLERPAIDGAADLETELQRTLQIVFYALRPAGAAANAVEAAPRREEESP